MVRSLLTVAGRNGELVSHYLHVYDRLPFQTLPSPNEDGTLPPARIKLEALDNCCQLQIELWELLLEYRYSAWDMVFFKKRIIDSSKDVNKTEFLLLVDVITEKLGRQAFSYESEGEHEQALRTLVSICGTGHIYNKDLATCDVYDGMGAAVDAGPKPHHLARCSIWSEMRIGTVLSGLYAEGLLQKPADADLVSLRLNAARVIQALFPLRFFISEIDWKEHFHSRDICPEASHPVEILNLKMSDLIRVAAKEHKSDWPRATGLSFSIRLMNVDELRNIGNINIEWTSNLYEHLELSFSGFATLKIYWFAWSTLELPIARYFCPSQYLTHFDFSYRMGTFAQNSREELLSTYHLLFGVPSRDSFMSQSKNALHKYNGITTHPSIFPHYPKIREHKRMGKLATKDGRPYNFGAEYHLSVEETHISNMSKTDHQQDRYENFPVFEDKLRILVAYMDTQKPGGLRGLWHDKRDSGAWFTFWAVSAIDSTRVSTVLTIYCVGCMDWRSKSYHRSTFTGSDGHPNRGCLQSTAT